MSWQTILKSDMAEVKKILNFVKGKMQKEFGEGDGQFGLYEEGELTEQVASDILYLLKEGGRSEESQIDDERNGTSLRLYIDDGFDLIIKNRDAGFEFFYMAQHGLYERMREGKVTEERVEEIIDEFLRMIGREDIDQGLTGGESSFHFSTDFKEMYKQG